MKNLPAFRQALEVLNRSGLSGNGESFMKTVVEVLGERDVLLAAARGRIGRGHNDTCGAVLSTVPYPCTCGQDELIAAIAMAEDP